MDAVAEAASMGGPAIDGNAGDGKPGDAGLGMLSAAHDAAYGKKKVAYIHENNELGGLLRVC